MTETAMAPYGQVFGFAFGALLLGAVLYLLNRLATAELRTPLGSVPFASGALPDAHAWNRFHVRYYVYALLFLAFDMEMVFMYPWAVVFRVEGIKALAEMGVFIGILLLGVLYAWRERAFEWA